MTYHLEIKKVYHRRFWNLGEKVQNSVERNFEWVLESPRRIEKFEEYSIIYGFGLFLAYDIIVVS